MAKTNRDLVGELMDLLKLSLRQYVSREYKKYYKEKYLDAIDRSLDTRPTPELKDRAKAQESVDVQGWLKLMKNKDNPALRYKLGLKERGYVVDLIDYRNDWAHQQDISRDSAYRCVDTASQLLKAIDVVNQDGLIEKIKLELLQPSVIADAVQPKKEPVSLASAPSVSKFGIKPLWAGWQANETVIGFGDRAYEKWKDSIQPGTRMLIYETSVRRPGSNFKGKMSIIGEVEVVVSFGKSTGLDTPTIEHDHPVQIKVLRSRESVSPIPLEKVRSVLRDPKWPYQGVAWYPLDESVYRELLKFWPAH